MTDDEHKRTLAAGVEFYSGLKDLLNKYGLDHTNGPSLVLVALGAVLATTEMSANELAAAGELLKRYWTQDPHSELLGGARFTEPQNDRSN